VGGRLSFLFPVYNNITLRITQISTLSSNIGIEEEATTRPGESVFFVFITIRFVKLKGAAKK
jgi:hypothetical protein